MIIQNWASITLDALKSLWRGFLGFIPNLIGAVIIFVVGWFISAGVGKLVEKILVKLKFNKIFEKSSWRQALEKAELKVDAAKFIGAIVKWVLVIVFLLAAIEILGLYQFAGFLQGVLAYLPNVIIAALIFVVTVILVDIVEKIVRASVEKAKIGYGNLVSLIVKWSIWVFAILAILSQLNIAQSFMKDLFRGIVGVIVITCGLAFGLGGREIAAGILGDLRKKIRGE